jgi:flagellar biosynthesis/type III secretory pathway protein FliH
MQERPLKAKPVQSLLSDEVWNACESEGVSADALTSFLLCTLDAVQDYESVLKRAKHSKSKPMNTESMSALQKLIHEGRTEGFAKGLDEGFLAGRRAGYREAVLDVLSVRFGEVPQAMKEHFESGCYDDELDRIRGLAKSAKSLQEFWQIARK